MLFQENMLEVTEKKVPPHEQEFGNTHKIHFLEFFFLSAMSFHCSEYLSLLRRCKIYMQL